MEQDLISQEFGGRDYDLEDDHMDTLPSENTSEIPVEPERSIMYAVRCTMPDVAFAQNLVSRYQQNPGKLHWVAVKLKITQAEYMAASEAAMEAVWI
ncbi:hypothetical protein Tco_0272040 [Tanacetum coccineum]